MREVKLFKDTGPFAENKDVARKIRVDKIMPLLEMNIDIVLDFDGIESATQSFIHAMISELIRHYGSDVLDKISFKNCNNSVKSIINIVVDYMQI